MEIHPKFASWLAAAKITLNDETLRKWWAALDPFEATAADILSLVQLARGADVPVVSGSRFYAAILKQDAALLPSSKQAIAALATAKLHCVIEEDSTVGELAALLCAINFPVFESQPPFRADLSTAAEESLNASSRSRADLGALVERVEQNSDESGEMGELERVVAVTAEETNILWWILGGRSRDANIGFESLADEVIPFVAAKELADLTTILPGPIAIAAFADRVCKSGRYKPPQSFTTTSAIKQLPRDFVVSISRIWGSNGCLQLCRLSNEIVHRTPGWAKPQKLSTAELALLFYRECLVPRAWKNAAS